MDYSLISKALWILLPLRASHMAPTYLEDDRKERLTHNRDNSLLLLLSNIIENSVELQFYLMLYNKFGNCCSCVHFVPLKTYYRNRAQKYCYSIACCHYSKYQLSVQHIHFPGILLAVYWPLYILARIHILSVYWSPSSSPSWDNCHLFWGFFVLHFFAPRKTTSIPQWDFSDERWSEVSSAKWVFWFTGVAAAWKRNWLPWRICRQ